jgi:hypothetical protein
MKNLTSMTATLTVILALTSGVRAAEQQKSTKDDPVAQIKRQLEELDEKEAKINALERNLIEGRDNSKALTSDEIRVMNTHDAARKAIHKKRTELHKRLSELEKAEQPKARAKADEDKLTPEQREARQKEADVKAVDARRNKAAFLLKSANAFLADGKKVEAKEYLETIISMYADTPSAESARSIMRISFGIEVPDAPDSTKKSKPATPTEKPEDPKSADKGTAELVTVESDLQLTIMQNGKTVATLDSNDRKKVDLPPGTYEIEAASNLRISTVRFTLKAGQNQVILALRSEKPAVTYLADLNAEKISAVAFKKDQQVKVKGVESTKSLFLHPPGKGFSEATYSLDGKYARFKASVAINDGANGGAGSVTPLTFSVYLDGKEAWKSNPVQKCGQTQECDLGVTGAGRIALRVTCPGDAACAHAVWLEPRLEK